MNQIFRCFAVVTALFLLFVLFLCSFVFNETGFAKDFSEDEYQAVFEECNAAHKQLEEIYSNVIMELNTNSTYERKGEYQNVKSDLLFWKRGKDYERLENVGIEPPRETITVFHTPKGITSLRHQPDGRKKLLNRIGFSIGRVNESPLDSLAFFSAPYSFNGLSRDIWFDVDEQDPKRSIKISEEIRNGKKCVVLQMFYRQQDGTERLGTSYCFNKEDKWAMLEGFMLGCDKDGTPSVYMRTSCEYSYPSSGVPSLEKYVYTVHRVDGTLSEKQEFFVKKIEFVEPPFDVFDVKTFVSDKDGLLNRSEGFSGVRIICLSTGILMIAAGIWMKIKGLRKKR